MRKTWLWTLVGMIGLALISYALFLWLSPPALPEGILYGNGRIEATEVAVSAEVGGRVLESTLVEGRAVQKNDLLVRLDEADLTTRLRQAEANAAAAQRAQAQVERQLIPARHHVQTADDDLARYRKLRETGYVSSQMLDRAENQQREARGARRGRDTCCPAGASGGEPRGGTARGRAAALAGGQGRDSRPGGRHDPQQGHRGG